MSLFVSEELVTVTIEGDYHIKFKKQLSVDEVDRVTDIFRQATQENKYTDIRANVKVLNFLIKEWNFTNQGQPVEISEDNISKLHYSALEKMLEAIVQNNTDLNDMFNKGQEALQKKKEDTQG